MLNASNNTEEYINNVQFEAGQPIAPPLLLQYWYVALRWKWVIGGIISAVLTLSLIVTLLATPKYTATSRIEISREQKKVTNVQGLESQDAGRDIEFFQTQYSLLEARSLAERVSRELRLNVNIAFFKAHGVNPDSSLVFATKAGQSISATDRRKREKLAVDILLKYVLIKPIRGSALVDIIYTSASPQLSEQIVNSWAKQFIVQGMDRRFSSTSDARKFLESRLEDLRIRRETSERELVNYAEEKGIIAVGKSKGPDGKTETERTLVSVDLEALNQALASAKIDRIQAQSEMSQRSAKRAGLEVFNNAAGTALRQRRAEVAAEYAKLMVQFEPGYPAARALAEQLKALDGSIVQEEGRNRSDLVKADARADSESSARFRAAMQEERQLEAQLDAKKNQMRQQMRDSIQYNIYQREADTSRELYDGLVQRYKEIGVAGVGTNNIAIVDIAKIPEKPSSPNLGFNMALALLAGLSLAAIATFALDQIDEGLRDPSQVNRMLGIPLLGSVPKIEDGAALLELSNAKSTISESYLSIRSNLAFSTDHGIPRSIMVTSTRANEGKSTSSFALATVIGRTGKKILLIDADMRSPSIHQYIGLTNNMGLSNFLAGENNWQQMVQNTDIKGLSILSAGPTPPSASELLSSDRMLILVEQLLKHFDHVVVDSPPILGLADAPLLSRVVEGCIFVAEAEGVAVRGIKAALGRLRSVQGHVLGLVMTKLHHEHAGYGYGYGYGYEYGMKKSDQT
jgi:polysaccharide biosynthesis transport protein